jgi:hypothetical protein
MTLMLGQYWYQLSLLSVSLFLTSTNQAVKFPCYPLEEERVKPVQGPSFECGLILIGFLEECGHIFLPLGVFRGCSRKDTYRQPEPWYALSGILARISGVEVEIVVGVLEKLTFGP